MTNDQFYYFRERTEGIQYRLFEDIEKVVPEKDQNKVKRDVIKLISDATDRVIFDMAGAYTTLKELEAIVIEVPQEEKEK